jgi:hypothetical protein
MFYLSFLKLCLKINVTISNDPFSKLALCMCYMVTYRKIMNPSMDHKHHNITYMLCIFSCTLSNGWWRFIIKWSNVCGTLQAKVAHFLSLFGLFAKCTIFKCHKRIVKSSIWQKYLWIKIANLNKNIYWWMKFNKYTSIT